MMINSFFKLINRYFHALRFTRHALAAVIFTLLTLAVHAQNHDLTMLLRAEPQLESADFGNALQSSTVFGNDLTLLSQEYLAADTSDLEAELLTSDTTITEENAESTVTDSVSARRNAIRVFVDCQNCDMNYIREEMPYVNYVRDVREAQVYLLVTRQPTGANGMGYTLFYAGQEELSGMKDTLTYTSSPDDTQNITRAGLTNTLAAGLMRYVAKTPLVNSIQFRYSGSEQVSQVVAGDPWNNWVFELQTQPRFSLEQSLESFTWNNSLEANRVTEEWKFETRINQNYNKNVYIRERFDTLGDTYETRTEAIRSSWNVNHLTVKSISNHWSVGARANVLSSTFNNLNLKVRFAPSVEYDIFPYSESTQRQLRILYGVGFMHNQYKDTTIYNRISESLFEQSLDIALQIQQNWGNANVSLGASNYLHDFSKYKVELDGFIRLRLFKGLSLNINGSVAFIHDQIELARGNYSDEDLYLRLRALETGYRYEGGLGITYTFGSIYNNVVNPRFGRGGGFGGGGGGGPR